LGRRAVERSPDRHAAGADQPDRGVEPARRDRLGVRLAARAVGAVAGRRDPDGRGAGQAAAGGPWQPRRPVRHWRVHRLWPAVHAGGLAGSVAAAARADKPEQRWGSIRMIKRLLWLALLPVSAQAADDFARQWPLQLSQADAGAYRVTLDAPVYAAAYWRDLRDVRVIDADGRPVASTVYAADTPVSAPLRSVELQWFALPAAATSADDDLSVVVERDARGRLLSIRNAIVGSTGAADPIWLVDLGDDAGRLRALSVDRKSTRLNSRHV